MASIIEFLSPCPHPGADDNRTRTARRLLALIPLMLLAACATSPNGRMQITAPASVSDVYSEVDMQLDLATAESIRNSCTAEICTQQLKQQQQFDQQVKSIGNRLADGAYAMFPDLSDRVSHFEFEVAEKEEAGSTSNASGKIVIFRGIQKLKPDDTVLAFLIAREMGSVIGRHHDENSATRILISVLAAVVFPASNLFNTTTLSQTALSSSVATTAASTATSYFGSKLALEYSKPEQLSEADYIALGLLEQLAWDHHDVAVALAAFPKVAGTDEWAENFQLSVARLQALDAEAQSAIALETLPQEEPQYETESTELVTADLEAPLPNADSEPLAVVADAPVADPSSETNAILASMEKIGEYRTSKFPDNGTTVASSPGAKSISRKLKTLSQKQKDRKHVRLASTTKSRIAGKATQHVAANHATTSVKLAGKAQATIKRNTLTLASSSTRQGDMRQDKASVRLNPTPILVVARKLKNPSQHHLPTI